MMIKGFISGTLIQLALHFGVALIFSERFASWSWGIRAVLLMVAALLYFLKVKKIPRGILNGVILSFILFFIVPVVFIYGKVLLTGDLMS